MKKGYTYQSITLLSLYPLPLLTKDAAMRSNCKYLETKLSDISRFYTISYLLLWGSKWNCMRN